MPLEPLELSRARVLIANDDGFGAEGLVLLERLVAPLVAEVWVVAPAQEQSGAGHSFNIHRPLRVNPRGGRRYTVDGTPTDCVLLGVQEVMAATPPDLILAGINRGGNLGEDVTYSGTVAVAMEGALMGVRAIALSQVFEAGLDKGWSAAEGWMARVLAALAAVPLPDGVFLNVNFPEAAADDVGGIEYVAQGRRKIGGQIVRHHDPRGAPYYWIGPGRVEDATLAGTDIEAAARGVVTVTPLSTDFTHAPTLAALRGAPR